MKRKLFALMAILAAAAVALGQAGSGRATVQSLVDAERGFAKSAADKGIRDAFIMNLADDATLFRPHAVAGKKWMTDHAAIPGLLSWWPSYAYVSRSGDLGYTTGPWEYRGKGPGDKQVGYGNFITLWKKQADGAWKVVVDLGISNPRPEKTSDDLRFDEPQGAPAGGRADAQSERATLIARDEGFSRAAESKGALDAYLAYAADDVRVFREDNYPFVGKPSLTATVKGMAGALSWRPAKADVSDAGDLGYTYGIARLRPEGAPREEYFNYLKIWKRQPGGEWKLALDVFNPCPPPAGGR